MPDDSPPGSGGIPTPGSGNLWWSPAQKRSMDASLRKYRQALEAFQRTGQATGSWIPPMAANFNGQMRDYLAHAVGLLRFHTNVAGFEFTPSIGIVAEDLRLLANGLQHYRVPLTRAVKQVMMPSIDKNFQENGRPSWDPLDHDTILQRKRPRWRLGPTPILQRTGRLKAAATSFAIWAITEQNATVKSLPPNVKYGYIHQSGSGAAAAGVGGGAQFGGSSMPTSTIRQPGGLIAASLRGVSRSHSWFNKYEERAIGNLLGQMRGILGDAVESYSKDAVEAIIGNAAITREAWRLFDIDLHSGAIARRKTKATIPPRRYIMFQEEDFRDIQQIFYDWMDEEIVKKGKFVPRIGF